VVKQWVSVPITQVPFVSGKNGKGGHGRAAQHMERGNVGAPAALNQGTESASLMLVQIIKPQLTSYHRQ